MTDTTVTVRYSRDGHTYVMRFDSIDEEPAIRALTRWAMNPELTFDFGDRKQLADRIRNFLARG